MNGDLLTSLNFQHLRDFHEEHGALATIAVRKESFNIPFGVVEHDRFSLKSLVEKPTEHYQVNAGIYVIDPSCLALLPKASFFNMTELIQLILRADKPVAVFPIREAWRDVGRHSDLHKARLEHEG